MDAEMTNKTAVLKHESGELSLPVLDGTVGPSVIDIRKLYAETDSFTYDPGFTATASCESKITYIDGDAGILLHRGIRSTNWPINPIFWRWPICCSTANCQTQKRWENLNPPSPITRWFTNNY